MPGTAWALALLVTDALRWTMRPRSHSRRPGPGAAEDSPRHRLSASSAAKLTASSAKLTASCAKLRASCGELTASSANLTAAAERTAAAKLAASQPPS